MKKNSISIFDNINGEIRRRNISQETLCEHIGIDRRRYSSWQAKGDMPISYLLMCAKFLNCSIDYLARDVKVDL